MYFFSFIALQVEVRSIKPCQKHTVYSSTTMYYYPVLYHWQEYRACAGQPLAQPLRTEN